MSALPFPTYSLENLHLFPVFQTREAFKQATGQEPPPFDPAKDFKAWFDPQAAASTKRKIVYENVIAYADNGRPLVDVDGKPLLEPLMIDREFAATVNIAPKGPGILDLVGTGHEIPVPLRAPDPEEELYFQFGGTVAVRNKALAVSLQPGFNQADRELLHKMAEKLGVK
ncbi:MAG: hypothetical protein HY820_08975 [Acidobacteria bacterium]|nr:hypothetical protein [Acidobacteriota bacterium]